VTDVFKKFAPRWKNAVRRFASAVWRKAPAKETDARYWKEADLFAREYRHALEQYYDRKGIKVYRGTIDGKVAEWMRRQVATQETIRVIAQAKKEKLAAEEFEKLTKDKYADVQKTLRKIYGLQRGENLTRGFSFGANFEKKAEQVGDEEAFAFGLRINEAVLKQNGDRYFWRTQQDSRVRNTHEQLNEKCFLFDDPPTTIDKYGNIHTGNPGTDWGCRCFADIAPDRERPLLRYRVHEKK